LLDLEILVDELIDLHLDLFMVFLHLGFIQESIIQKIIQIIDQVMGQIL